MQEQGGEVFAVMREAGPILERIEPLYAGGIISTTSWRGTTALEYTFGACTSQRSEVEHGTYVRTRT